VSAFSARQRLWGAKPKETAPAEASVEKEEEPAVQDDLPSRPASTRRKRGQAREAQLPSSVAVETSATTTGEPSASVGSSMPDLTSDGLQNAVSLELETESTQRSVLHHSSFRPSKGNYQRNQNGQVTLRVPEGERLVILGSYGIEVTQGELTIAGATIRTNDPISWVHSPHCHAIPVIRTTKDSTVELRSNPAAVPLREFERLNPVFNRLWNEPVADTQASRKGSRTSDDTYQIIFTSDDGPKRTYLQELNSPAEWNRKLAEFSSSRRTKPPVILVCGPKSSGKSTFGKLLANRLVTSQKADRTKTWANISVLDIDPGQPEYGPPGVISLVTVSKPNLAPSFCHTGPEAGYKTIRSHAIAAVSPGLDAERFVESAVDLFVNYAGDQEKNRNPPSPLVINTPGWVQGTGLDILTDLIKVADVTEVVYMSQDGPEETVDELKKSCAAKQVPFTTLPSQTSEFTSRTALHYRTMQTISYFHLKPSSGEAQQPQWDSTPLTEIPPWKVRYKGPNRGIYGVMCYDYQPSSSLLAESINGMVVALVEIDDVLAFEAIFKEGEDDMNGISMDDVEHAYIEPTPEGIPYIQNPPGRPLFPGNSKSIGLALIRGIDVQNGEFQLITPLAADTLRKYATKNVGKKLVLVAGKFDTPSWAYTEDFYRRSYGNGQTMAQEVVVADEDTDDDASEGDHDEDIGREKREYTEAPWVEMLHGDQKRSVGSRVWRVRRDLGKG
jgi:polynucleotide 5'-hydroxyl-kinase GRC3/NOL9